MKCLLLFTLVITIHYNLSAEAHERFARILNGHEAVPGQFKFMAALVSLWSPGASQLQWSFCGGTFIAPNWILTTAHCLFQKDKTIVYLGILDKDEAEICYVIEKESFVLHPEFRMMHLRNDIALLPIPKTDECDKVKIARLPHPTANNFEGSIAFTMGWGDINNSGDSPNRLLWAGVKIISNEECKIWYDDIIDSDLCVNTSKPYGAPCIGDSGGPLMLHGDLIGVVSAVRGDVCADDRPAIFARVPSYMPWIIGVTGIRL